MLNEEWLWALALCALPFLAFGAFEAVALIRRRQREAIARRPKDRNSGRTASGQW